IADHLTAALPPIAAIAGLVIALSVIKQVTLMDPLTVERATTRPRRERGAAATEPEIEGGATPELQSASAAGAPAGAHAAMVSTPEPKGQPDLSGLLPETLPANGYAAQTAYTSAEDTFRRYDELFGDR